MQVSLLPKPETPRSGLIHTKPGSTKSEALSHLKNAQREADGELRRLAPGVASVFSKGVENLLDPRDPQAVSGQDVRSRRLGLVGLFRK